MPHPPKPLHKHFAFGWCHRCQVEHRLDTGNASIAARQLMMELEANQRIDLSVGPGQSEARFSTDYLFGKALGQMFGVLECKDQQGKTIILKGFSGQYNGVWNVEGWVPPLFKMKDYDELMIPGDLAIKELGRQMDSLPVGQGEIAELRAQRKKLSQSIMKEIQGLYLLRNFRGERRPLNDFFQHTHGPPTGAGDCCAPKLLSHAALHNLRPLGIAEFYWGKPNRSATRQHGEFSSSCVDKCVPILGFMLCGAQL